MDNKIKKVNLRKARETDKWAEIMTKWLVRYSSKNNKLWRVISFRGRQGQEATGIVDLIAIRKDHKTLVKKPLKRGDLFEIIIIQVKGGSAPAPTDGDNRRLLKVGRYYRAKYIVLAIWKKAESLIIKSLARNLKWKEVKPKDIFG